MALVAAAVAATWAGARAGPSPDEASEHRYVVLPFDVARDVAEQDPDLGEAVTALAAAAIGPERSAATVGAAARAASEARLAPSESFDDAQRTAALGASLRATRVVVGRLRAADGRLRVAAKVLDVRERCFSAECAEAGAPADLPRLVPRLLRTAGCPCDGTELSAAFEAARLRAEEARTLRPIAEELDRGACPVRRLRELREAVGRPRGSAQDSPAHALLTRIDRLLVPVVLDEARAAAAKQADRAALATCGVAEDDARSAIEHALQIRNEEDGRHWREAYRDFVAMSDQLAGGIFTDDAIAVVPWRDLLTQEEAGKWATTRNVPGFSATIRDGVLVFTPPETGSRLVAFASVGDRERWRHFVLDMAFRVVGGAVKLYFHAPPAPASPQENQCETFELYGGGTPPTLDPGTTYEMRVTYVGSRFAVSFPSAGGKLEPYESQPSWTKRRWGGIAFAVPEGANLQVTRMRLKEL